MNNSRLLMYWDEIPIGKENAITYENLMDIWGKNDRKVRMILHELSLYDNGDDYILIRSANGKGFYRTDDIEIIKAYRKECLNKGRSMFAPVKKINRVLNVNTDQYEMENNLRVVRESIGMKQKEVCNILRKYDRAIDTAMLSKMENGVCLPTPYQLSKIAEIYCCNPDHLINIIHY